jgi:cell division septation protein DedD
MSMHDSGYGRKVDPAPEFQSDFTDSMGNAQGTQPWSTNAPNHTQTSEGSFMAQGAGRPGHPILGQNTIFGGGNGGGPVFAQMPSYTPVTRGPEPLLQPLPPQPAYNPYAPNAPAANAPAAPSHPNPYSHQPASPPSYLNFQPPPATAYQPTDFQPQPYRPAPQQPYPATGYNAPQDIPSQAYQPQPYPGAGGVAGSEFPERIFPGPDPRPAEPRLPDPRLPEQRPPEPSFADPGYAPQSYAPQSYAPQNYADASFPEPDFDASFPEPRRSEPRLPEPAFPAAPSFAHGEPLTRENPAAFNAPPQQGFEPFLEEGAHDYSMPMHDPVPPSDPRRQLQAFDAPYDQPPQLALGSTEPRIARQDFYEAERMDADFLDESQMMPPPASPKSSKLSIMKGRSAFMVASALLGAIALGGALAFAYKQSGGVIGGETPVVQADNRPVKELPDQPGGKDFPHKNKLIYDRLSNEAEAESERLVPRQENVAVPALPSATMPGLPGQVATTDFVAPQTTQAVDTPGEDIGPDGGPRRVKTLVVRPDGSVMPPPEGEAPAAAAAPAEAAPAAAPLAAAAAPPVPEPAPAPPPPAPAPAPQQVAAATPAPAPAAPATPSKFVVQLGAQKTQTEALATFADMQQKYPTLLANYRPMVQKANVASGTVYRLRVGPIDGKSAADKLCGELKAQGTDCFVAAQ